MVPKSTTDLTPETYRLFANGGRAFRQEVANAVSAPVRKTQLRLRAVRVARHINKAVQIATFAQFPGWIPEYCPSR